MEEKKKRNQYEFDKRKYDHIHLQVAKGKKEQIQSYAIQFNKSMATFINEAIDEKIARDTQKADN